MIIDISLLNNNLKSLLEVEEKNITFDMKDKRIKELIDVSFKGRVKRNIDDTILVDGILQGIMRLQDDITLEDVDKKFSVEIKENIQNTQNYLDISKILWENILVEIPLKVRSEKSSDKILKGEGWRVITEEELAAEKQSNNPFKDLAKLIEKER